MSDKPRQGLDKVIYLLDQFAKGTAALAVLIGCLLPLLGFFVVLVVAIFWSVCTTVLSPSASAQTSEVTLYVRYEAKELILRIGSPTVSPSPLEIRPVRLGVAGTFMRSQWIDSYCGEFQILQSADDPHVVWVRVGDQSDWMRFPLLEAPTGAFGFARSKVRVHAGIAQGRRGRSCAPCGPL